MFHNSQGRPRFWLDWPEESLNNDQQVLSWSEPGSNICLDLHGNPADASLVVFSDGNHHMALKDCLDLFQEQNSELEGIFYLTTPPGPILKLLSKGSIKLGNLQLKFSPHVFISPPGVLDNLVKQGWMADHLPFVRNQGNVLLVRKGNPKKITRVRDLAQKDVRIFLSNPRTEQASYQAYTRTLEALAPGPDFVQSRVRSGQVVMGRSIHHREAPQALVDGVADVAVVFYHLGLRYIRIFPELFTLIPLGGSIESPDPLPGNVISRTHMGLIHGGGLWGRKLISFLGSAEAMEVYQRHGLCRMVQEPCP
ncbi:substrate-binding domain-containing protein [Desulfonatronovibrio hydrogenovorans]|uniref:substrate-binding domain-containing protein n=1 Tax=Desulfonatronovibrio hydrogenovorans TaxID=53245 RepID=UPI0012374B41|nr:substrate-binding domain-containing protein [Desulfonatronovibrio hydrogenovorans]